MRKVHTQVNDIIEAMKNNNGYATLAYLNQNVDTSNWKTKTPFASIRCYLQRREEFFKIQSGLWALTEYKDKVLGKFKIKNDDNNSKYAFEHSYYQGLIVEIGNMKNLKTYIPSQDKNKFFMEKKLAYIVATTDIPKFTYNNIIRRASTVDIIWFNERGLPSCFYEVEHSTNIINSLNKFYELQDFRSKFFIVADSRRKAEFEDKISQSIYHPIKNIVTFVDYDSISNQYLNMTKIQENKIII